MPDHLSLAYDHDPTDDFGWLRVSAEAKGFAAKAGFWVQWQDVVEWAAKLDAYPLPPNGIEQDWGFVQDGTHRKVISIGLKQSTRTGRVTVRLELTDYHDPSCHAEFSFQTAYSNLDDFKKEVEQVMAQTRERATLLGF